MRAAAFQNRFACFLLLLLAAAAPRQAQAQAPNAAAVERWIDGLLAETRSAGAIRSERGAVSADGSGAFVVAGVTIELPDGVRIALTRIAGEGVAAGGRFAAQRLRLEGFSVNHELLRVDAPEIELQGLDLPSLAPAAFFGRSDAGLVATLRELNLARLSIPSLTMNGNPPIALQSEVRGVLYEGIVRGVAQRVAYGESTFGLRDPQGQTINGSLGSMTFEAIDIALHAEVIAPQPGAPRELRQAYARGRLAGAQLEASNGVRLAFGPLEIVNARLRPPRTGYLELLRLSLEMQGRGQPSPELMQRFAATLQDYFEISETERITLGEVRIQSPEGTFRLGGFEGRDVGSARFGRLALSEAAFESPPANLSIGTFTLTEVDYTDALRIFFDSMAAGNPVPDPARFEGRLPRIGGIELRDVALEARGQGTLSLDSAVFAMGRWRGFVPDLLRLTVSEFSMPSAYIESRGPMRPPRPSDLGYESVDVGSDIQIRIDERARTATLSPGRIEVDEFGAVAVELTLGDVDTAQLGFAGLSNPMPLLQQTTFRELRLRIENSGFLDRYASWTERTQGMPAAQFRTVLMQGLAPLVELFVQDPAQKERARAALQAFGREQRSLTLVVTPRGRLSLLDIMAAAQGGGPPLQLLGQVNLELTAND